jgi:hypothetical protein
MNMKSKIKTLGIIVFTAVIALIMNVCTSENNVDTSQYYVDPPAEIAATILSDRTLHLTWNAVSEAESFSISVRTNLDSADTRLSIGSTSNTRYEHNFYSWYWGYYTRPQEVTTLYYYIKSNPRKSGYVSKGWSNPVSVDVGQLP